MGEPILSLLRQNWGNHSSLTRAEQPYAQRSSREENRGPAGAASACRREPAHPRGRRSPPWVGETHRDRQANARLWIGIRRCIACVQQIEMEDE
jgi:hypothetical protein